MTKPAKSAFAPSDLVAILADIDAAKPPRLSVRDAVRQMSSSIKAARSRGCQDDQLLALLAKHGIVISVSTLRAYLSDATPKSKPPAKAAAAAAVAALDASDAPSPTQTAGQ